MQAFINSHNAKQFVLAGNALITIKSLRTSKHFTYKIRKKKDHDIWFVSVAYNGAERMYHYIGCILPDGQFKHTQASRVSQQADSFIAFAWSWNNIHSNQIEIYHEGRCARCGRTLTEPESIQSGFGPTCRAINS